MTWNSSCSIASDDDNSRQSFLSDCDSEFDLRPPPRYPAEKRSYSTTKKQMNNRIEPPMTRSRAKATGQTVDMSESLSKPKRHSTLRRSVDAFNGAATSLTNSLNSNLILFSNQDSSVSTSERILNSPLDGVNILADRFESCSLDEGKLNKNCLWPSRETNSHYMRPIMSPSSTNPFSNQTFSSVNDSPLFTQSSTPILYGQRQVQLWSRFRFAASTLRNNLWLEQTDTMLHQVPSNLFSTNFNNNNNSNRFNSNNHSSSMLLTSPQTVPTRLVTSPNRTLSDESTSSSSIFRQRKMSPENDSLSSTLTKENISVHQTSMPKALFTLTIFAIGLVLGYLLTNTLPPRLLWELCVKYFHVLCVYFQNLMSYIASLRLV